MRFDRSEEAESEQVVGAATRTERPAKTARRFKGPRLVPEPRAIDLSPGPVDGQATLAAGERDARFRRFLALVDAGVAGLALGVVTALGGEHLRPPALLGLLGLVALAKAIGLYERDELLLHKSTLDEAPALFQLATLFTVVIWLFESELITRGALGKIEFALLWAVTFGGLVAGRTLARALAQRTTAPERCLLLGPEDAGEILRAKLDMLGETGAELVAREDLEDDLGQVLVCGRLGELVHKHQAERIIVIPTSTESDALLDLIREAKTLGVKVSLLPRFTEVLGSSMVVDDLHGVTLLAVRKLGLSRSSLLFKRSFDLLVSLFGLLAIGPLLAVIAAAIKLDSRGPVFYRQTRIGRHARPFSILKFRTMVDGADEQKAAVAHLNEHDGLFKISDDPRVTRVGRWLRRTALDELPQLFNVVSGDMSLVGPRPLIEDDDRRIVGWHRDRLCLAPGMTGHWQVLGAGRVPLHEMVAIDYLYVANWTLWTDLKYLLRTVPYVLRARGL